VGLIDLILLDVYVRYDSTGLWHSAIDMYSITPWQPQSQLYDARARLERGLPNGAKCFAFKKRERKMRSNKIQASVVVHIREKMQ
jgi:hypothetical protein